MQDHYASHMLPALNASMFAEEGYVHVSTHRMSTTPLWKVDLWLETIVFYTNLNNMYLTRTEVKHGVVEITWEPR